MNITLSADKKIIEKARMYARRQNTSLNNLVREYLIRITDHTNADKAAEEFASIALEYGGKSGSDYKFNREDIYNERGK
ncbi:MAG: hypothetical protein GQ561_05440 [Calditrichae bacterium]|nr:hypothetical protein [Calditrichia bacterium]